MRNKEKHFYAKIEIPKEKLEKKPEKSFAEEVIEIYKKQCEDNILFLEKAMKEMYEEEK